MKLAAWSIDRQPSEEALPVPKRIGRSHIGLEKHLQNWIANDVALIGEGLTLVGCEIAIDDGRLDLLAIDTQDRWVVIEIKPGMLDRFALTQALYYASSLARLGADELLEKLEPRFGELGNAEQLSAQVKRQLENEDEGRVIAVLLVGAGVHAGLERMNGFLGGFGVPIGIVSFEVFEMEDGPRLLIREVLDEQVDQPARPHRRLGVDEIRRRAVDVGMGEPFDRFVTVSREAGLATQAQRASVRIAPQANRTRFLMYARPDTGNDGGVLHIAVGPQAFAEFFPHVTEQEAVKALDGVDGTYGKGKELDAVLDRIKDFLADHVNQVAAGP
ncbi:MAG: endonuclease NucS [bacterium]|nr:endonuclease NucS [bacterium]MDE0242173.1 endonuclease NucS [bacterium]MDE0416714.1 endonuclease NucS [bacterium]